MFLFKSNNMVFLKNTEKKIKNALFAVSLSWNSFFKVGSHHIAHGFLKKGFFIDYVSFPVSPFHIFKLKDENVKLRFKNFFSNGIFYENKKVYDYVPFSFLVPFNTFFLKSIFVHKFWPFFSFPNLNFKFRKKYDFVYTDNAYHFPWIKKLNYDKLIYRVADKHSGFKSNSKNLEILEKKMIKKADLVVYSNRLIESYIKNFNPKKMLYVPNGVNTELLSSYSIDMPEEYNNIPKPIVFYVGALNYWFDVDLLIKAAKNFKEYSFVIVGPYNENIEKLKSLKLKNVYYLGPKKHSEIGKYMFNSDVGIIPFKVKEYSELVNAIHPLKLYEYFYFGLPVVASEWNELKNINSPAFLYNSKEEFFNLLEKAINKKKDTEFVKSLKEFAEKNSWEKRVKKIMKELKEGKKK